MPLAVNHRLQSWHIGHFGTEMFLILTIVECALDVFSITASTILPSLLLLVEQLVCLISLPMYVGMRDMPMMVGMVRRLQSAQTPLKQHLSFLLFLYSEYLPLVHIAELKSVYLALMRLYSFLPLYQ